MALHSQLCLSLLIFVGGDISKDIWITWVNDGHAWDSEEFTTSGTYFRIKNENSEYFTEIDVVSIIQDSFDTAEDGVVFQLSFPDGWAIVGDKDQLCFSLSIFS